MKGGGSRLNVNIHKPRSALIRIENKVLPSAAPPNRRPRPPPPPAAACCDSSTHQACTEPAARPAWPALHGHRRRRRKLCLRGSVGAGPRRGSGVPAPPHRTAQGSRRGMAVPRASCLRRRWGRGGKEGGRKARGGRCTWWPRGHGRAGGGPAVGGGQGWAGPGPRSCARLGKRERRARPAPAASPAPRGALGWRGWCCMWLHLCGGNSCAWIGRKGRLGNPSREGASGKGGGRRAASATSRAGGLGWGSHPRQAPPPGANLGGCAGLWLVSPAVLGRFSAGEPRELSPARSHHRLGLPQGTRGRGRQKVPAPVGRMGLHCPKAA